MRAMAFQTPWRYRDRVGARFFAAVLVACSFACESRVLGPVVDSNAGTGGHAGTGVNTGQSGTVGTGGDGGLSGTTGGGATSGTTGIAGTTGGGATGGTTGIGGTGFVGSGSGGCGISCGPSACPVRDGQPRVVATSPQNYQLMALAVNADTLFWGTYPNQTLGEVRSMPLAGGPSTLLAANVIVSQLHLDGSTLYYVTNDRSGGSSLLAIPATGGTPRTIATGSQIGSQIAYVTSNASGVYFAQNNVIMRVDPAGAVNTPVAGPTGVVWGFAVDETNVYWAAYANGGALYRRALTGGDTTTMRTSTAPITFPTVDGDDIDFIEGTNTPATCASAIWAIAKVGGAPRLISPGTSGIDVARVVRDGTTLYWASNSPHGAVLRMIRGQTPETPEILAAEQVNVGAPVVGATDIYWIASAPGGSYEIRTLPK